MIPSGFVVWRAVAGYTEAGIGWRMVAAGLTVTLIQLLIEPVMLAFTATTPGKMLLGLSVRHPDRTHALTISAALSRTLKVAMWGLGLWLLPLMPLVLLVNLLLTRKATYRLLWDRSGEGTVVVMDAFTRPLRALAFLVAAAIPGVLVPFGSVLLLAAAITAGGTDVSQDISRAVTGQWRWLHRLSGESIALDTRWRVSNDHLFADSGEFGAAFSLAGTPNNRVRVEVEWREKQFMEPCDRAQIDMSAEGFLFLEMSRTKDGSADRCRATGGKVSSAGVVHIVIDTVRDRGIDHVIIQTYEEGNQDKRDAVQALAERLRKEIGREDAERGRLRSYHWRNELTGVTARLPGDWQFYSRLLNRSGGLTVEFRRYPTASRSPRVPSQVVTVSGFPWFLFEGKDDLQTKMEDLAQAQSKARTVVRRTLNAQETVSDVEWNASSAHFLSRVGGPLNWAVSWSDAEGGPKNGNPDQHELLKLLMPTIR
jgi:hypothetical protein